MHGQEYGERPLIMYRTLLHLGKTKHQYVDLGERSSAIPDEHLAQSAVGFSVLKLLSIGQLEGG